MNSIAILPISKDNYAYILRTESGNATVIDPGEAQPILDYLDKQTLRLTHILNTHHHGDHCAGNSALKQKTGAQIIAPAAESEKIGNVDQYIEDGEALLVNAHNITVIATPGHTLGSVCFYVPAQNALFTGDTLFSLGCGRLFEGTAENLWNSFQKILTLPDQTLIYPGHEYTLSNGAFCTHIEPNNADLRARLKQAEDLRAKDRPTVPVTLGIERKTNVFLRARDAKNLASLRKQKDNF